MGAHNYQDDVKKNATEVKENCPRKQQATKEAEEEEVLHEIAKVATSQCSSLKEAAEVGLPQVKKELDFSYTKQNGIYSCKKAVSRCSSVLNGSAQNVTVEQSADMLTECVWIPITHLRNSVEKERPVSWRMSAVKQEPKEKYVCEAEVSEDVKCYSKTVVKMTKLDDILLEHQIVVKDEQETLSLVGVELPSGDKSKIYFESSSPKNEAIAPDEEMLSSKDESGICLQFLTPQKGSHALTAVIDTLENKTDIISECFSSKKETSVDVESETAVECFLSKKEVNLELKRHLLKEKCEQTFVSLPPKQILFSPQVHKLSIKEETELILESLSPRKSHKRNSNKGNICTRKKIRAAERFGIQNKRAVDKKIQNSINKCFNVQRNIKKKTFFETSFPLNSSLKDKEIITRSKNVKSCKTQAKRTNTSEQGSCFRELYPKPKILEEQECVNTIDGYIATTLSETILLKYEEKVECDKPNIKIESAFSNARLQPRVRLKRLNMQQWSAIQRHDSIESAEERKEQVLSNSTDLKRQYSSVNKVQIELNDMPSPCKKRKSNNRMCLSTSKEILHIPAEFKRHYASSLNPVVRIKRLKLKSGVGTLIETEYNAEYANENGMPEPRAKVEPINNALIDKSAITQEKRERVEAKYNAHTLISPALKQELPLEFDDNGILMDLQQSYSNDLPEEEVSHVNSETEHTQNHARDEAVLMCLAMQYKCICLLNTIEDMRGFLHTFLRRHGVQ